MDRLRRQLHTECDYHMKEETMDRFLELMTEVNLKNNEPLISYGKFDNNIYIVKDGIIRYAYFDGEKEKTIAFATSGSILISYHSFYMHAPSVFQLESCGKSVVMKISKAKFDELMQQCSDFMQWMFIMSSGHLYYWEKKTTVINGTAKERFEALVKNRPEILKSVSNRVIASYIGVTPEYLSAIKSQFIAKQRK